MDTDYDQPEPTRDEVNGWKGPAVLEFGANWCGICRAAQIDISIALSDFPGVLHRKVGDGPGKPLGRSFRVTLWPTLIYLRDGQEVTRIVRPESAAAIRPGLGAITSPPGTA